MRVKGMPVKKYKVRYVVFKTEGFSSEDYGKLIKLLKDSCEKYQPGFRFKIVREYGGIVIVRCPHKVIPALKLLFSNVVNSQLPLKAKIIGISGTLKKSIRKFCDEGFQWGKDYKA
ncbi:MAG: hypothetical protein ACUVQY_08185 [Thermoproteota archaeon]